MIKSSLVVLSLLLPVSCFAQRKQPQTKKTLPVQGFDLRNLNKVIDNTETSASDRIELGVNYLQQEIDHPSPSRWGLGGGPIDTGAIRQSIIGAIAFPGAEAPSILRSKRDKAANQQLRDYLTIALAQTGGQDAIPDLLRIATTETIGSVRWQAIVALTEFTRPPAETDVPKRLRPGETWRPIDPVIIQKITLVLVNSLNDSFKRYQGKHDIEGKAYYPIIEHAYSTLKKLGYGISQSRKEDVILGWQVFDKEGRPFKEVLLKEPIPDASQQSRRPR